VISLRSDPKDARTHPALGKPLRLPSLGHDPGAYLLPDVEEESPVKQRLVANELA